MRFSLGLSLECEWITLLEDANVLSGLAGFSADHQQVRLKHRDGFGDEFNQWSGSVGSDGCIHCILKDVGQLAGNFREEWEPIRSRGAGECVRRDVKPLNVGGLRVGVLKNAGVLTQELQVLRSFLEKDLYEFCIALVQAFSCPTASARRAVTGF